MAKRLTLLLFICSSLFITACGGSSSSSNANNIVDLSHIYTYIKQTPSHPMLDPASCVNNSRRCSVAQLPFIAISYPEPSIEQVMSRVVVSHDWMGERFATLLAILPDEILTLLGSVTAIVIADNVRPSFYWTGSGAIYLDPASLWLSNDEKLTINQDPDYRDVFSTPLSYDFFHRFVKDNQPAYTYYSLNGNEERSIDDIIIPMASLLFHELAHANDFMPATFMPSLNMNNPTSSEINLLADHQVNKKLQQSYPISDSTLKAQASILYSGRQASEAQTQESATYLGLLMEQEGANHLYAYTSQAEDVAMLFQATMLDYYYGIKMDSAFIIQPSNQGNNCDDYIVGWGQRHRIADPISKPRAQFVSQQLLPNIDFDSFFNEIDDAQYFPEQSNWCNINLSESSTSSKLTTAISIKKDHHHGVFITFK